MSDAAANPHDAFARIALSQPQIARALVEELLPPALRDCLDLERLDIRTESFVDEALRGHHADMVYVLPPAVGDAPATQLYILVEHKSHAAHWTLWQLSRYRDKLWQRWRREHPDARRLPPVLPVILHHGERPWAGPEGFCGLIDTGGFDTAGQAWLAPYLPDFRPLVVDLTAAQDAQLARNVWLASMQQIMKHIRSPELPARLPGMLRLFARMYRADNGIAYLAAWLEYVVAGSPQMTRETTRAIIEQVRDEPGGQVMGTLAQLWIDEGREEGRQEGREQGRAETVLRLVEKRFGPLSQAQRHQVLEAATRDIDAWLDQLMQARSLADLLKPD